MKKPLAFLLSLLLAPTLLTARTRESQGANEALLKAACESKGGLLISNPVDNSNDKKDAKGKNPPKKGADAPADKKKSEKESSSDPEVVHFKAEPTHPESSSANPADTKGKAASDPVKECRKKFAEFYAHGRNSDLKAAILPEIDGELKPEDRMRMLSVLARSAPLQSLKKMTDKSIKEQQLQSRSLFDGTEGQPIKLEELTAKMSLAEMKLDRRATDAAAQATAAAQIHLRDLQRQKEQRTAGKASSPDLRSVSASEWPKSRQFQPRPDNSSYVPAAPASQLPSALKNLTLADVPSPTSIPTGGISRGSILADVKAALAGLGVSIMGRQMWHPTAGHDASQHSPMKITVHHSAGAYVDNEEKLLDQITGWEGEHIAKGYGRMGYHWVIDAQGNIAEGQATELVGSHTKHNNEGNIGICLAGNFDKVQPSEKMLASLIGLMAYVATRYNMDTASSDFIQPHRRYVEKSCPGKNVESVLGQMRAETVTMVASASKKPGFNLLAVN